MRKRKCKSRSGSRSSTHRVHKVDPLTAAAPTKRDRDDDDDDACCCISCCCCLYLLFLLLFLSLLGFLAATAYRGKPMGFFGSGSKTSTSSSSTSSDPSGSDGKGHSSVNNPSDSVGKGGSNINDPNIPKDPYGKGRGSTSDPSYPSDSVGKIGSLLQQLGVIFLRLTRSPIIGARDGLRPVRDGSLEGTRGGGRPGTNTDNGYDEDEEGMAAAGLLEGRPGTGTNGQTRGSSSPNTRAAVYRDSEDDVPGFEEDSVPKDNYALCENGAFVHRVYNWPPFKGEESVRGAQLIVDASGMDSDKFWRFNPVGDVEIRLSDTIQVTGMSLKHPADQNPETVPKDFEFYGVEYTDVDTKNNHLFGSYTHKNYKREIEKFSVQKPSSKKFSIVRFRFLNTQVPSKYMHVYRVEVHGLL